jgi:hypothetical protein
LLQFRNVWNLLCINLFNFLIFQLDGIFCSGISQFGPFHKHASSPWTCYCDGSNWFFVEVCAKEKCSYVQFHYNNKGVPRSVVQISNITFSGDEFGHWMGWWYVTINKFSWSGSQTITMIPYSPFAFLLNKEKI